MEPLGSFDKLQKEELVDIRAYSKNPTKEFNLQARMFFQRSIRTLHCAKYIELYPLDTGDAL